MLVAIWSLQAEVFQARSRSTLGGLSGFASALRKEAVEIFATDADSASTVADAVGWDLA
jgi:hypothetical protein